LHNKPSTTGTGLEISKSNELYDVSESAYEKTNYLQDIQRLLKAGGADPFEANYFPSDNHRYQLEFLAFYLLLF